MKNKPNDPMQKVKARTKLLAKLARMFRQNGPESQRLPGADPAHPGAPGRKPSGVAAAKRAKQKRKNVQARRSKRK